MPRAAPLREDRPRGADRVAEDGAEFTEHARNQAHRRGIDERIVRQVLEHPEEVLPARSAREVRQSRVSFPPGGKIYLVRVVVDRTAARTKVVTVYRTRKFEKYRSRA